MDISLETPTRTPSPTFPPLNGEIPDFKSDASIVLVGIRGAGKSTLAIIASSAMKRKVVDLENAFQRTVGVSSPNFKKARGAAECHHQQFKVLQTILERYRTDAIIVCSWMESRVQSLLRDFASTCPVVHIVRDAEAIRDHLKLANNQKLQNLLSVSEAIFRTCTNFEFFNVSDRSNESEGIGATQPVLSSPYLTLKQAEKHFLKFLSLIYPPGTIKFMESAFPLANVPVVDREFTYAVSLSLESILGDDSVEEKVLGADVIQLVVPDMTLLTRGDLEDGFANIASSMAKGVAVLRRTTALPILVHIVLPEEKHEEYLSLYCDLISHAFRLGPEFTTLDLRLCERDITRFLRTKGRGKVMAHRHFDTNAPSWRSPTWITLYKKASHMGCDIVRLLRSCSAQKDEFGLNRLRIEVEDADCPHIPLVAFNTGSHGRHTACFNQVFTTVSPSTNELVTSQLTAKMATKSLFSSYVYDPMKLYVFGAKVDYSMSPAMHNSALEALGVPHRYAPHSADSLSKIRHLIEDPNFGGASVGLPFKVEIITVTHSLSRHAQAIGAANTLIPIRRLSDDGSIPRGSSFFNDIGRSGPVKALYGENTDWIGIRACIRRGLSPANAVKPGTCGMVIGAGGMARAAVYAMLQIGVQNIAIYNRTKANADKMASHFAQLLQKEDFQSLGAGSESKFYVVGSRDESWPAAINHPTIIVSCIPTHSIGDMPAPDFVLPEDWLKSRTGGVVIEFGYKTLNTPLLTQVRRHASRGWVALDGLDLLPEQGYAQFEFFTGRRAPRMVMRRSLWDAYMEKHGASVEELRSMPREATGND
ncbi:hypothetical protein N3K66_000234 [Trichothecium roseum]|uniref:Uncharacterized protein n=1 Tax=Trichothecium roseum TaxID=47278 RepID=A0ACC0VD00_9HYPO|nr:hypothetical protein N3K66_000234 [Trichothecium roseum]